MKGNTRRNPYLTCQEGGRKKMKKNEEHFQALALPQPILAQALANPQLFRTLATSRLTYMKEKRREEEMGKKSHEEIEKRREEMREEEREIVRESEREVINLREKE